MRALIYEDRCPSSSGECLLCGVWTKRRIVRGKNEVLKETRAVHNDVVRERSSDRLENPIRHCGSRTRCQESESNRWPLAYQEDDFTTEPCLFKKKITWLKIPCCANHCFSDTLMRITNGWNSPIALMSVGISRSWGCEKITSEFHR